MLDLLKQAVISRVSNAVSAGTTDINCTSVDMAGFDAVTFVVLFGALTSTQVTTCKLQHSDDNSTFTDVTSGATSALDDADGNKMQVLSYKLPSKRYVRVVIDRGTANAVVDGVVALQYRARTVNTTQGSTVQGSVSVAG